MVRIRRAILVKMTLAFRAVSFRGSCFLLGSGTGSPRSLVEGGEKPCPVPGAIRAYMKLRLRWLPESDNGIVWLGRQ